MLLTRRVLILVLLLVVIFAFLFSFNLKLHITKQIEEEVNKETDLVSQFETLRQQHDNITKILRKISTDKVSGKHAVIDEHEKPNIHLMNPKDPKPFAGHIVILVFSHIGNPERRNTIRSSWGDPKKFEVHSKKYNNAKYKVYFITGFKKNKIHQAKLESEKFGDLLITNRTEGYYDISRRTMFGFQWSLDHCKYNYILKTDDDIFVNIPNLYRLFYADPFVREHAGHLYTGYMHWRDSPERDKSSKWYISREEWGSSFYPPFATGMAITLSRNIVEMIRPYFYWKDTFRLEDVNIGYLVFAARVPGLGIRPNKGVEFMPNFNAGACKYLKQSITCHPISTAACMKNLTQTSILS